MKTALVGSAFAILLVAAAWFFLLAAEATDRRVNAIIPRTRPVVSEAARRLHERLLVADLHADTLLWARDPLQRSPHGHVDLPRLREGNVALQAFTVVTKAPRSLNIESNDDRSDNVTLLAIAQHWPPATWFSLKERALHQARRLDAAAARSGGRLTVVRSRADLAAYLQRRSTETGIVAGVLGLEGAHALEGELANLDVLFAAGFRMVGLVHFFDNELAGSAHGIAKGGLTGRGRDVVRRLEQRRMLLDLAHASPLTIRDALAMATRPVVVSHTGVKGTCDNVRNLDDDALRGVARTGGLVGIGFWETAVCGTGGAAVARAIRHAAGVAGVEHVALGSDFDGAVAQPFDTTGLVEITDALLAEGFSEPQIAQVMGGNVLRLLSEALP
ncbi:MAG TPA: dipeptidase [Vicinamibacteria bacterium]|jgi:microsomal dipeptidase-like Zn-dependent dipeptidase